jgi:hypothetical protein
VSSRCPGLGRSTPAGRSTAIEAGLISLHRQGMGGDPPSSTAAGAWITSVSHGAAPRTEAADSHRARGAPPRHWALAVWELDDGPRLLGGRWLAGTGC